MPAGEGEGARLPGAPTLIAERDARSRPCESIREQLSVARGGVLRRGALRRHVRQCAPCDAYRLAVAEQRDRLAAVLPVLPTAGLKAAILAAAGLSGGGGSAAAAAGGAARSAVPAAAAAPLRPAAWRPRRSSPRWP